MKCAPILVTTLCRDAHFIRLFESLRVNTWAKYTDVFVGLDFPIKPEHMHGYKIIGEYLDQSFPEFKSVTIFKRKDNYGSSKNMKELRDFVLNRYDRFIRTDDDAEFSPNFLEYMNKCLDKYALDKRIIAVTGYSYPINWHVSSGSNILEENFSCPMWGTGFWRDKFNEMSEYIESSQLFQNVNLVIRSNCFDKMLDVAKYEYINSALSSKVGLAHVVSDVSIRMYMAICDKSIIVPLVSKVRNHGFDGTGEYCQRPERYTNQTAYDYDYANQEIDSSLDFTIKEDELNAFDANRCIMNEFDYYPIIIRIKYMIKMILCKIFGYKFISRIINHN